LPYHLLHLSPVLLHARAIDPRGFFWTVPTREPLGANDHPVMNVFLFRPGTALDANSTFVFRSFFLFDCDPVSNRPWISAYSGHLPGDFDLRLISFDRELVVSDFVRHNCLGKLADHGQLEAKILICCFKVMR